MECLRHSNGSRNEDQQSLCKIEDSSISDKLNGDTGKSTFSSKCWRRCQSFNFPALLLIVIVIPAGSIAGFSRVAGAIIAFSSPCNAGIGFEKSVDYTLVASVTQSVLVYVAFPIAGWLADTRLGQFRVVYGSIWCFWCGILCFGFGCVLRLLEPCDGPLFISGKYAANVLALVFIALGAAGFFPNILVLLMDQLPDISSSRLRSCIHWFVWALYFGFFCENWMESGSQLYPEYIDKWFYVAILVAFTNFSIILVLLFFFRHKFIISFARTNPYYTAYKVLAFAKKHKTPLKRSAFTYWENKLPSRIDLAKNKYGGPFSHEKVEDVKTLLRILGVFLALFPFFVGYTGPLGELIPYVNYFSGKNTLLRLSVFPVHTALTLLAIPVLELIVLPLFPKLEYFFAYTLRWLFLACILLLLTNASLAIIAGIASYEKACFFEWDTKSDRHEFSFQWLFIPSCLWSTVEFLMATSIFRFICSQSPHTMRGMLLGMIMFLHGLYTEIGMIFTLVFDDFQFKAIKCGIVYWLLMTVMALIGCFVFGIAVYFYQKRVREEVLDERGFIESVYEREIALEAEVSAMFASSKQSDYSTIKNHVQ